jgi:hypothetical protein
MSDKIVITLHIEEEDIPVVGNALASEDDAQNKACEAEILERLRNGDQWAWCFVIVEARCGSFLGRAVLGGCSYKDEADFKADGCWADLKHEAIAELVGSMNATLDRAREAKALVALIADGKIPVEVA